MRYIYWTVRLVLVTIFVWVFVAPLEWFGLPLKLLWEFVVTKEDEDEGADISECGLEAYPEFCN